MRGAGNFAGAVLLGDRLLLPGLTPTVGRSVGEFELIIKAGYRKFGIAAAHPFRYTPADSQEMTGPEILEPVVRALINTIEAIQSSGVRN